MQEATFFNSPNNREINLRNKFKSIIKSLFGDKHHSSLSKASSLFNDKKYEQAIKELELLINTEEPKIKEQAISLIGLCYLRLNKNKEATFYFNKVCSSSKNYIDWLNLAVSSALNNEIKESKQAFNQTIALCSNEDSRFIPQLRSCYINALMEAREYVLALEHMNILWESYIFYSVTDEHFPYVRGMPLFRWFMSVVIDMLNGLSLSFDKESWLAMLYENMDDDGKEIINEFKLKLIKSDNNELNKTFDIPLPLHPRLKPVKICVEDILNDQDTKCLVCRVFEGTLKLGDLITLDKKSGKVITGECLKLETGEVNALPYKSLGIVYIKNININDIKIGDCFFAADSKGIIT